MSQATATDPHLSPNPLMAPWPGPWQLPPFEAVRAEHFAPAFDAALRAHREEVEAIATQAPAPDFGNTVAALDASGLWLERLELLLSCLTASVTTPALQAVEREMAGPLAAHRHAVATHPGLYARLCAVAARTADVDDGDAAALAPDQRRLVERLHLDHRRAGAGLPPATRAEVGRWTTRLAELHTAFGQRVLADEEARALVLRRPEDVAGLPEGVRAAARQAALDRGHADEGMHVVALSRGAVLAFLTHSPRRDLREAAWRAWTGRGHGGAHDNAAIAREILQLRQRIAAAHGEPTHAHYALADSMARAPAPVRTLMEDVWQRARPRFEAERAELEAYAAEAGHVGALEPWDWRYFAERLRAQRHALDEGEVKAYFALPRVVEAAFDCAGRLFGLDFVRRPDLPAYHADVDVYEVRDRRDGDRPIALFLQDNCARPGKRSGAWMSVLRTQSRNVADAVARRPIVLNNNNCPRAAGDAPTLLSLDDARTVFHEFGHALHGLLSDVRWRRQSGTNVLRDFVELPSQLFEHWILEPAVLRRHARHAVTGEPMPEALIARLQAAAQFHQGYETLRYLGSALVDLALHEQPAIPDDFDVAAFEAAELQRLGAPALCGINHRALHFQHLFAGLGYDAGYYVYLWAEVLDADAYDAFREAGDPFDPAVAARLRDCIFRVGDSVEPGATYRAYRGRDASPVPMLRERGLLEDAGA